MLVTVVRRSRPHASTLVAVQFRFFGNIYFHIKVSYLSPRCNIVPNGLWDYILAQLLPVTSSNSAVTRPAAAKPLTGSAESHVASVYRSPSSWWCAHRAHRTHPQRTLFCMPQFWTDVVLRQLFRTIRQPRYEENNGLTHLFPYRKGAKVPLETTCIYFVHLESIFYHFAWN